MNDADVRIALGPVGAAGLLLLVLGAWRRSSGLAALGAWAVAADVTLPQLHGFAALHEREARSRAGSVQLPGSRRLVVGKLGSA